MEPIEPGFNAEVKSEPEDDLRSPPQFGLGNLLVVATVIAFAAWGARLGGTTGAMAMVMLFLLGYAGYSLLQFMRMCLDRGDREGRTSRDQLED